jgi:hypothetical protein
LSWATPDNTARLALGIIEKWTFGALRAAKKGGRPAALQDPADNPRLFFGDASPMEFN